MDWWEANAPKKQDFLVLPPTDESVATARQYVLLVAATLGIPRGIADDLVLIMSEIATNVIDHTQSSIYMVRVWYTTAGGTINVGAVDMSRQHPVPREAEEGEENGRGLTILDALSHSWGCVDMPDGQPGKAVYASVKCSEAASVAS